MSLKDAKILIVAPNIHGPNQNGTIGTTFSALAHALKSINFFVTILYVVENGIEADFLNDLISEYARTGIRLIPLPEDDNLPHIDARHSRVLSWKVDRWMRHHADDYSVAIFPEWMGLAYYAVLARRHGLAYRDLYFVVNPHNPRALVRESNWQLPVHPDDVDRDFMERESVAMADAVISPSQYLMDWMRAHTWNIPDIAQVIPNLMEIETTESTAFAPRYGHVKRLVVLGGMEVRPDLGLFCDAFDRIPLAIQRCLDSISFLGKPIMHDGFNSLKYIQNRSSRWSVSVEFNVDENREQVLEFLLQPENLIVIPSLIEDSAYSVLECLEQRIRFIASRVGSIPELIAKEDQRDCLFDPVPSDLAIIIETAVKSGALLARAAQSQAEIVQKWRAFFTDLLGRQSNIEKTPRTVSAGVPVNAQPLVSVCLVHHERPLLLARAIDSLRKQSYRNFEIVLVDDGSCSEQAKEYLDTLLHEFATREWQLLRQPNRYLGAARNHAAAHARGEFLLFMDDDNIAMPHELEIFVRAITKSGADVLTCVSALFSGDQPPERPTRLWLPLGGSAGSGLFSNVFGDANALWRASVFHALGGFTEDYGMGHEDWELFANAVLSGYRLELVPEPLFWYRVNQGGMLRSGDFWAAHARSVRPYLRRDPSGLGVAAAYAVYLQQTRKLNGIRPPQNLSSFIKDLKVLTQYTFNRQMWIKLRTSLKRHGIRKTIGAIRYHLQ